MRRFVGCLIILFALLISRASAGEIENSKIGVLILAHGAGPEWNEAIKDAVSKVNGSFRKIIVFGMGDAASIQSGIDSLEKFGVKAIVVVPLFVSSHSEMYRNLEYILGFREEPDVLFWMLMTGGDNGEEGEHAVHRTDHTKQVKFSVPYTLAPAINYHPLIAAILEERVREYGEIRKGTSVFLVAHGPVSEDDNMMWLLDLNLYAVFLSGKFAGADFFTYTFRDDAPRFIRDRVIEKIREAVRGERNSGKEVVIVPYLLAPGGRESELRKILENCSCRILLKTLLPHANISSWIEEKIQEGKKNLDIK